MNFRPSWRSVSASLVFVFAFALPAQAQSTEWSMTFFRSQIMVNTNASITVTETIQADFSSAKHGIFRNIPWRYATEGGGTMQVPIEVEKVDEITNLNHTRRHLSVTSLR